MNSPHLACLEMVWINTRYVLHIIALLYWFVTFCKLLNVLLRVYSHPIVPFRMAACLLSRGVKQTRRTKGYDLTRTVSNCDKNTQIYTMVSTQRYCIDLHGTGMYIVSKWGEF